MPRPSGDQVVGSRAPAPIEHGPPRPDNRADTSGEAPASGGPGGRTGSAGQSGSVGSGGPGALEAPTPGPALAVRAARIEDLAAIVDLLAQDGVSAGQGRRDGGDMAPYAAAFARMTAERGQVQAVAQLDGQVVGTLALSVIPGLAGRGATRAQIDGVCTLSTLRGRGIGEALFAWAIEQARARGAVRVQLFSEDSRANEHRFYAHLGFRAGHTGFTLDLV